MLVIDDDKCTGCTMCGQLCPKGAIRFENRNGFRYPQVLQEKCINCELCIKRCPAISSNIKKNNYPTVYAAWTKNEVQRIKCTSGGVLFELSKFVIENGGFVAGVSWCDGYKNAEYILINQLEDLAKITQTKYFQPNMNKIFADIKSVLDDDKTVLFIGTSCSNAGLLSFLGKKYENLIICDFICRGYTTQEFHQKRIEYLEKKHNSKIIGVQYKNKELGWSQFGTMFDFENGDRFYLNREDDPYEYMLQIDDYVTRTSCFECKYRTNQRITDITVGDFWGIKEVPEDCFKKGVSVVLVNSSKGIDLLNKISQNLILEKRSIFEVSQGNLCLTGQLNFKKEGRETFYHDLDTLSIPQLEKKYGNVRRFKLNARKKRLLHIIRKIISIIIHVNLFKFVHYNFFCKKIERKNRAFLFPYFGSCIDLQGKCKIILEQSCYINFLKHKGAKEQCILRMYPGSLLYIKHGAKFAACSTIEILHNAKLTIGSLDPNYNTTIICSNEINIGDDVQFGRNVTIYDSNFHPTKFNQKVKGRPLNIGRHVWLCTNVCIVKGLNIGDGAICSINSTITRNVMERTMVMGNPAKCVMENVEW